MHDSGLRRLGEGLGVQSQEQIAQRGIAAKRIFDAHREVADKVVAAFENVDDHETLHEMAPRLVASLCQGYEAASNDSKIGIDEINRVITEDGRVSQALKNAVRKALLPVVAAMFDQQGVEAGSQLLDRKVANEILNKFVNKYDGTGSITLLVRELLNDLLVDRDEEKSVSRSDFVAWVDADAVPSLVATLKVVMCNLFGNEFKSDIKKNPRDYIMSMLSRVIFLNENKGGWIPSTGQNGSPEKKGVWSLHRDKLDLLINDVAGLVDFDFFWSLVMEYAREKGISVKPHEKYAREKFENL